eukprot:Rhum_TRINITY_DN13409_c1_g1::Rhum_TRINITY_DN13409_c1_g1_i1::g.59962::m.59962
MIVVCFLLNFLLLWAERGRPPPPSGCDAVRGGRWGRLFPSGVAVQAACGVAGWCWSFRSAFLPRPLYTYLAAAVLLQNAAACGGRPGDTARALLRRLPPRAYQLLVRAPAAAHTSLMYYTLPVLPFVAIWTLATPLPEMLPLTTQWGIRWALPLTLLALTAASVVQSAGGPYLAHAVRAAVLGPRAAEEGRVVSMLHRQAGFTFAGCLGRGECKRVAYGVARRRDAEYVRALLVSDLCLGCGVSSQRLAGRYLAGRVAAAPKLDLVLLTGDVVSPLFAAVYGEGDAARRAGLAAFFEGYLMPGLRTRPGVRVLAALDTQQERVCGSVLRAAGVDVLPAEGEGAEGAAACRDLTVRGRTVHVAVDAHAPLPVPRADLALLLATSPLAFAAAADPLPHDVALCGGTYACLVRPSFAPYVLGRVAKKLFPTDGLWGKGAGRLVVSNGVGCPGYVPSLPVLRLGMAYAEAPLLHIEIPPRVGRVVAAPAAPSAAGR